MPNSFNCSFLDFFLLLTRAGISDKVPMKSSFSGIDKWGVLGIDTGSVKILLLRFMRGGCTNENAKLIEDNILALWELRKIEILRILARGLSKLSGAALFNSTCSCLANRQNLDGCNVLLFRVLLEPLTCSTFDLLKNIENSLWLEGWFI